MKTISYLLCITAFYSTSAFTALVITNGSFESFTDDDTLPADNNHDLITNWFEASHGSDAGTADESAEQVLIEDGNRPLTSAGDYWGHLTNKDDSAIGDPAIYQSLGTWNTGDEISYDFIMILGDRSNQPFMNLTVEFFSVDSGDAGAGADGTTFASAFSTEQLLASDSTGTIDGGGGTLTSSYGHTFDFNAGNLTDGDSVWLRISGVNTQTDTPASAGQQHSLIDDLQITAIPEPSTFLLFGLAGITALIGFRRRR